MGLKSNKKISHGIRRIANKQAAGIGKHLKRIRTSDDLESVHEARKHIKKLRALLRLIRGKLGYKNYHRQTTILREVAHRLSDVRDATIQLKTLASLYRRHSSQFSKKEFFRLKKIFSGMQRKQLHALKASKGHNKTKFKRVEHEIARWKIRGIKKPDLQLGIENAQHRFMEACQKAKSAPDDKTIHEWRKRTKDLLYESGFLENLKPKFHFRAVKWLKKLAKHLGDAHDLAVLETKIAAMKSPHFTGLIKLSGMQKTRLQRSAFALAGKKQ